MKKILGSVLIFGIVLSLIACNIDLQQESQDDAVKNKEHVKAAEQDSDKPEQARQKEETIKKITEDRNESSETKVYGRLITENGQNIMRFDVADFIEAWKEKGNEYFQGKTVIISGKLDYKPDIILHEGVSGERFDVPIALLTTKNKKLAFELSIDTNNYIIEKVNLGDEISFEVNDFDRLDALAVETEGYYVYTEIGNKFETLKPNIIITE